LEFDPSSRGIFCVCVCGYVGAGVVI